MPRWQRLHLTACAFVTAYALTYVVVDYLSLGKAVYLPHARAFVWTGRRPSPLEMGYVGQWIWALAGGLVGGGALFAALAWRREPAGPRALGLGTAWSLTALLLAGAYFTWHNWP